MRPWTKILTGPVRHVLICKLCNRYASYCIGHHGGFDRNDIVRYGVSAGR
jgi:hypothetical protein